MVEVLTDRSVIGSVRVKRGTIFINRKQHKGFREGINKEIEYSWFYILCLRGLPGETVTIIVNEEEHNSLALKNNGLVFKSKTGVTWCKFKERAITNRDGLYQKFEVKIESKSEFYVSNTIFFDYAYLEERIRKSKGTKYEIGMSLEGRPLTLLRFGNTKNRDNRILVTTGCHPAEPDVMASFWIVDYLESIKSKDILNDYVVDIIPMQNPDGYVNKSCLTANGINLYWNFRKDDKVNCPEAYYLWKNIEENPPVLYLDFHAYVHQHHRHPQPYIKPLTAYQGKYTRSVVREMDRKLIKLSQGYYHYGKLSAWPNSLTHLITKDFNCIAYTKYHINVNEGLLTSSKRVKDIFLGLTKILKKNEVTAMRLHRDLEMKSMTKKRALRFKVGYLTLLDLWRKIESNTKSYWRYYFR